jgi:hypothetical protein
MAWANTDIDALYAPASSATGAHQYLAAGYFASSRNV